MGACQHLCESAVGGFSDNNYWSSTENSANNAWKQNFNNGNQNNNNKSVGWCVRAVRGFEQASVSPGCNVRRVFYDPAAHCVIKGKRSNWKGLPDDKSLFHSRPGCGLPIGNLTSQVFANFYLNSFDHFMKHTLALRYYGRYVDDVVVVHQDPAFLNSLLPVIRAYLQQELGLILHPKKIFLEHYTEGVKYLGVVLKPRRIYVANRTKGNMYRALLKYNQIAQTHKPWHAERTAFQSSINSYLGLMKHYHTYSLRRSMLRKHLSPWWLRLAKANARLEKFTLKIRPRRSKRGRFSKKQRLKRV